MDMDEPRWDDGDEAEEPEVEAHGAEELEDDDEPDVEAHGASSFN